jgi:hypothetical protein
MAVNINVPSQVKTYANLAAFPASGALKTIYIAEDTNKTYRWTGSVYVEVSASASGITIGTTLITSGTVGRVLFEGTGNVVQESANLFWDNTNGRLGIGTSTPSAIIHSVGSVTASGAIARANFFNNTLVAAANNDALVGLDIQPTFTNGAFTGVENIPLRFVSQVNSTVVKSILLKNTGSGAGSGVSIGFNNINTNNLSNAFIKSYYVVPSGMAMSFGTGGGSSLTSEGTTALVLNADQTANFTARVIANSGGFQATGVSANLLMSDNGTPVITRNGSTGIQFLKDAYWQTFSIFTNNTENLRVASTGNVLINTTTDAGFRLDVNGTSRITGLAYQTGYSYSVQRLQFNQGVSTTNVGYISGISNGVIRLTNASETDFTRLQFGGGTTSYPSLQRSGSALSVMDATGTALTNLLVGTTTDAGFRLDVNGTARVATSILVGSGSGTGTVQTGVSRATYFNSYSNSHTIFEVKSSGNASFYQGASFGTTSDCVASAQVQIDSTTKGFLPPRMTTTEKNAIASPATGLQIFDTTLNRPCFYDGTTWITL